MILNLSKEKNMSGLMIYDDKKGSISMEALYAVDGYITYNITVSSIGFSGYGHFCIHEDDVQNIVLKINNMQDSLCGKITIEDGESDAFLKVSFQNDMNLFVSGQLGGSYEDNMLKFKIRADQTMLSGLKEVLMNY